MSRRHREYRHVSLIGDLVHVSSPLGSQVFYVEYHDPNDTDRAYGALNNKRMFGARLKFSRSRPDVQPSEDFAPVPSPIPFASLSPNPNGEVDISSPKNVIQSLDADGTPCASASRFV